MANAGWDDTRLEVLALQSIVDSRQPAPVSPVEPTPPKCDECGLELGIKALFDGRATAGCGACAERKAYDPMAYTPDSVEPTPAPSREELLRTEIARLKDAIRSHAIAHKEAAMALLFESLSPPAHAPAVNAAPTPEPETCEWRWDHASEVWRSSCPTMDYGDEDAEHDTPTMGWKVCPYCTHPVRLVPSEER